MQVVVILATARAMGALFQRIGQPAVVAEIVAGLCLGPSLLGRIWPGGLALLFPPSSLGSLDLLAQLGLVLFMFVVGMEFDPGLLQRRARLAAAVSASSILVPFLLGMGLGYAMHDAFAPDGVALLPFSLFLGAATCVTAFPVLARILSERGLTRTELGSLTMTCAAANDAVAWCVLAFVVAIVQAGNILGALRTSVFAACYVVVMLGLVRPFTSRLLRRFQSRQGLSRVGFAMLMLLLFSSALVTHAIGIHALFGAFVFGAVLPRDEHVLHGLTLRIEDVVVVVLLPLFFAATGLRTQVGSLDTPELWGWCGLVVAVATSGKVLGSAIPARLGGLPLRESVTLGALMNTRGLMELIILEVGRQLGVLSPMLFTMFVLMAVSTTFLTPPLLHLLYPRARVLEARAAGQPPAKAPLAVPDFSLLTCVSLPASVPALARASALLGRGARAYALSLLSVQDPSSMFPESAASLPDDEDPASSLARQAAALGLPMEPMSFPSGDPGADIVEIARLKKADLLVVGSHRPLFGHALLGGPLVGIARHLDGDLAILVDRGGREELRRVLAVRDGPHTPAVERVIQRISRAPGVSVEWLDGSRVKDLYAALRERQDQVDLVVLGLNPRRGVAMHRFDLRATPVLEDLSLSVLVMHGPDGEGP